MDKNPMLTLRTALSELLDGAAFEYGKGDTRKLIRRSQRALARTAPVIAHTPPAGIFKYDVVHAAFVPVSDTEAKDKEGNLLPGYTYLFKQPPEMVPH